MTHRTTFASALLTGGLLLAVAGCGQAQPSAPAAQSPSASTAAPTASVEPTTAATGAPLTLPSAVPLDMSGAVMGSTVSEMIDAAHIASLGADTEKALAAYRSFTDLQKGSHVSTPEDWKVVEPVVRPVSAPSMWDWLVKHYADKGLVDFAPQLGGYDGLGYPLPSPSYAMGQGAPDAERFVPDERGYTWVTNSGNITVEAGLFEEGHAGVMVSGIRERLLVGTTDNRVAYYDMDMTYTMEPMADGSWTFRRYDYTQDTAGIVDTQEELDALPPL